MLMDLFRALEREGVEYVLIGATALAAHGIVRATEDIDIILRATPENLERLRRALGATFGQDSNIAEIRDSDLLGDYPAVRYYPQGVDLYIDLLTRLGEVASYESVEAETKLIEGIGVRVATPRALYELKKDTLRPLDRADAERRAEVLLQRATGCSGCGAQLARGQKGYVGLSDLPRRPRAWLCSTCIEAMGDSR